MTIGGAEPRFPTGPRDQKLVGEKRIEPFAIDRDEMQALLASDKHLLIPSRFVIYSGVSARFEPATMRVFTQWSHPGADEEDLEGTDFELARTMISLHEPTHLIDTCNSSLGFRIFMTGPWGAFHVLRLLGILSELAEHDSPPSLAEVRSNVSVVEWLEGHQLAQLDSRMLDGFRVEEDQPAVIWPGMEERGTSLMTKTQATWARELCWKRMPSSVKRGR